MEEERNHSQTSYGRGKGTSSLNHSESQAEENSSCKFIKNPKHRANEDISISFLKKKNQTSNGRRMKPFPNLMRKKREISLQISYEREEKSQDHQEP